MIEQKSNIPANASLAFIWREHRCCRLGMLVMLVCLLGIAVLVGVNLRGESRVYVAGQVAERDVIADRDLLVMDAQATAARRKQVMMLQPQVYDLSFEPYSAFHQKIMAVFRELNDGQKQGSPSALERLRGELTKELADEVFPQLAKSETQKYVQSLLPSIRKELAKGLVSDIRTARIDRAGVIIHNLDSDTEILHSDIADLPDVQTYLTELSNRMRTENSLDPQMRRAINVLLTTTMPASLTLNREATLMRAQSAAETVDAVYYQIQKGELVVRKGDRVSREQQIKLQALHNTMGDFMHLWLTGGVFLFAVFLGSGFFMTPSGRLGRPLRNKDLVLISCVLVFGCIGAKICFLSAAASDNHDLMQLVSYSYPIAAAVGLVAMVFAARRYLTISLLLAFFYAMIFGGEIQIFLFHFLSAMLITWLVGRAQSRQDVVLSIFPLAGFQVLFLVGAVLLGQEEWNLLPLQMAAVCASAIFSLLSLFALSPVLEMLFGYTTRFRLMELMSLDHPLMQELMVNMPGTYHHSLVVANMVEAGAKAVGANSMLCKVAALYHDVGKMQYPLYFIENQFGGENKHDKLAPSMSALVIISHVKKGTELAEKYKLGQEIIDVIRQHHGTRSVRYFYQKAIQLGESPRESDYCYPGPRPQTKEAAIIMLADAVEASSRTLSDPTPARIQSHIDGIIKGIFSEGQLDESELTFKDLHRLSEGFVRILTGIFHQRIAYPAAIKPGAEGEKPAEKAPVSSSAAAKPAAVDNSIAQGAQEGSSPKAAAGTLAQANTAAGAKALAGTGANAASSGAVQGAASSPAQAAQEAQAGTGSIAASTAAQEGSVPSTAAKSAAAENSMAQGTSPKIAVGAAAKPAATKQG
ncbi:MAG: HDIG domain-containing protein [Desulfovibrionaceae bacterium]|nr:HDIG domain-containing protein [Desulfovibrionaceae bacterium]